MIRLSQSQSKEWLTANVCGHLSCLNQKKDYLHKMFCGKEQNEWILKELA